MHRFKRGLTEARPQRRSLALLALVSNTLVVVVLAACGGDGGAPADVEELLGPGTTEPPPLTDDSGDNGRGDTEPAPATSPPLEPATPAPPAPLAIQGRLEEGAEGTSVERLQEALAALGFDPGPIDGLYGPMTSAAVEAFKRAQGLSADGIANEETVSAINRALKEQG